MTIEITYTAHLRFQSSYEGQVRMSGDISRTSLLLQFIGWNTSTIAEVIEELADELHELAESVRQPESAREVVYDA